MDEPITVLHGRAAQIVGKTGAIDAGSEGKRAMAERNYEPMTKAEVVAAQRAWAKCVTEQDVDNLLDLYDFGTPDEPLLFKPTLADVIRLDRAGARSYFVGGDPNYPHDSGFLKNGWKRVEFQSAAGPILKAGGLGYKDMGHCSFYNDIKSHYLTIVAMDDEKERPS